MGKLWNEIKKTLFNLRTTTHRLHSSSAMELPKPEFRVLPNPSLAVSPLETLCIVHATLIKYNSPIPALILA